MRSVTTLILALTLVSAACGSGTTDDAEPATTSTTTTTTLLPPPTTTMMATTTTVLAAPLGYLPPYHMVMATPTGAHEYWYLDWNTTRETIIESTDADRVGTFTLVADGYVSSCFTLHGFCKRVELGSEQGFYPPVSLAPVEQTCTETSMDTIAQRSARHFVCQDVRFVAPYEAGELVALADPGGHREYWFDSATGIHVKSSGQEATLLEVDPTFPSGIFEYKEMIFS